MSRTRQVITLIAALVLAPALAAAQGKDQATRGYQEHDRATGVTFSASTDSSGNAVLTLRGGEFSLEKVVSHTGDATLRLSQGKDVVAIALTQSGVQIARGGKTLRIDSRADANRLDSVRSLLLGSQSVRSFKRLVASLEQRDETEEDGPLALSALVDGAIVHLLDGDADAPNRIAKRITRKQRAALRVAKAARLPGAFIDCVGLYQVALMRAYSQFESCAIESFEYSWWSRDLVYQACSWEWVIRSQQYVWQFVGCFMFPW